MALKMAVGLYFIFFCLLFIEGCFPLDQAKWSLLNLKRKCDEKTSSCDYSFFINEDENKLFPCSFHVVSMLPQIPAANLTFQGLRCNETDKYSISLNHNDSGRCNYFSVVKPKDGILSYFGFEDDEVKDGAEAKPKTSEVYPLTPPERGGQPWTKNRQDNETNKELEYAKKWTVFSPIRRIRDDVGTNVLDLAFLLLSEERGVTVCNIHLTFPKGKDARNESFFHEKCTNSDWYVSWGYNDDNDSAVMTVINPASDRHAWFGWDKVNKRAELLGTCGPSKTEARKDE